MKHFDVANTRLPKRTPPAPLVGAIGRKRMRTVSDGVWSLSPVSMYCVPVDLMQLIRTMPSGSSSAAGAAPANARAPSAAAHFRIFQVVI